MRRRIRRVRHHSRHGLTERPESQPWYRPGITKTAGHPRHRGAACLARPGGPYLWGVKITWGGRSARKRAIFAPYENENRPILRESAWLRPGFHRQSPALKLGLDVHADRYVVVRQFVKGSSLLTLFEAASCPATARPTSPSSVPLRAVAPRSFAILGGTARRGRSLVRDALGLRWQSAAATPLSAPLHPQPRLVSTLRR